jgi:transcriptional regulator with XRE-family HTH domain
MGDRAALLDSLRTRLRLAVSQSGQSRSALADRLGLDRSTLSELLSCRGRRLPRVETLVALARATTVSVDWLLGLEPLNTAVPARQSPTAIEREGPGLTDKAMLSWIAAAAGTKIRYLPANLPQLAKIPTIHAHSLQGARRWGNEDLQESVTAHLQWARWPGTDMECSAAVQTFEQLASGTGIWAGLPQGDRARQLTRIIDVVEELYPRFRLFLYDGHHRQMAPFTIFGNRLVALYVGGMYLVLRDQNLVEAFIDSFDELVRAAVVQPTDVTDFLSGIRSQVR